MVSIQAIADSPGAPKGAAERAAAIRGLPSMQEGESLRMNFRGRFK